MTAGPGCDCGACCTQCGHNPDCTSLTTQPDADTSIAWRCPSIHPDHPTFQCVLPVNHHGRDAVNNWDLHQDEEGEQWS